MEVGATWAEAAVARWHAWDDAGRPESGRDFLPRTVGVDVARTGQDRTVLEIPPAPGLRVIAAGGLGPCLFEVAQAILVTTRRPTPRRCPGSETGRP